ncbi:MAG: MMPL family transporter [Proteobacteria bacterium]|nr:MMPL family transporter [Pseudomonadota bacterium]
MPRKTKVTLLYIPDFSKTLQKLLDGVLPVSQKYPVPIILLFMGLFIFCLYGATQVKIDSNFVEVTKEGSWIRNVYDVVDEHMMGTQNMEILVDTRAENGLKDPKVLKAVERLQTILEERYSKLVSRTSSLADVVKDANQVLNEGREEMYVIPDDSRVLAQTLFLFDNANPKDRRRLVSDDYGKSHVSVQLYNTGSYEYTQLFREVQNEIRLIFDPLKSEYPELKVSITGGLALMMEMTDYISWSQIKSLGLAIAVISVLLMFVFGSLRAGILSIVPNLLPATITFGLLGLLDIPLDADTVVIAPVIIGIAVDDTIHFITHYRGEVLKDHDIARALKSTIHEVGHAVTFTSLILGIGFSIMAFSENMSLVKMGTFGTLAIFVALLCDLYMLPALIIVFKPKFLTRKEKREAAAVRQ